MVTIILTATGRGAGCAEREIIEQEPTETRDATQAILDRLEAMEQKVDDLSQTIYELQSRISEIEFKADPMLALSPQLQEYTYWSCIRSGVDYELFLKLMFHESGFQVDAVGYNRNGTRDYGLCQINEINHSWLIQDHGLDVREPESNIDAGVLILAMWLEKYPDERRALAAYAAGESGMLCGEGFRRADEVLSTQI